MKSFHRTANEGHLSVVRSILELPQFRASLPLPLVAMFSRFAGKVDIIGYPAADRTHPFGLGYSWGGLLLFFSSCCVLRWLLTNSANSNIFNISSSV